MKNFNLKLIGAIVCLSTTIPSFSQNNWTINGNGNTDPTNNFLGTTNNFGLSIRTFDTQRLYINGNRTATIDGFGANTSGFVGIGTNIPTSDDPNGLWTDRGPFSLLHLNGITDPGDRVFDGGYRSWMRTSISFTDQTDLAYVGYRHVKDNINDSIKTLI